MLNEISCPLLSHEKINFHKGLNVILGDDDAKNSIGKSTALMIIDFVQGGDSFLEDEAGVINALGHHYYNFNFIFHGHTYYFSRSTSSGDLVQICNSSYEKLQDIEIDDYRKMLKHHYGLDFLDSSFRSIVSPFIRIWKKGGLDPDQPFISHPKEINGTAINRLIDILGFSERISKEKKVIDSQKNRKKIIVDSMSEQLIPHIKAAQFKENIKAIQQNNNKLSELKNGFASALSIYETLFDENLRRMQLSKNGLVDIRNQLQIKITRLENEISGINPKLSANIALIAEYFPEVNIKRLEQVEEFHKTIGKIVKKELNEELLIAKTRDVELSADIAQIESKMKVALDSKGLPDDLFKTIFELKEETDKATEENKHYELRAQITESIKISNSRLGDIYTLIFTEIESRINQKLKSFNKVVYGPARNSSILRIKNANSYSFTSPEDSGTGKSYAGLIGFDIAMISLTKLPFFVHDSVVYKNIEVVATKRILRILAAIKTKQVFLAFDESKKFGARIEELLHKLTVVKLSHNDLLYKKDWREKK